MEEKKLEIIKKYIKLKKRRDQIIKDIKKYRQQQKYYDNLIKTRKFINNKSEFPTIIKIREDDIKKLKFNLNQERSRIIIEKNMINKEIKDIENIGKMIKIKKNKEKKQINRHKVQQYSINNNNNDKKICYPKNKPLNKNQSTDYYSIFINSMGGEEHEIETNHNEWTPEIDPLTNAERDTLIQHQNDPHILEYNPFIIDSAMYIEHEKEQILINTMFGENTKQNRKVKFRNKIIKKTRKQFKPPKVIKLKKKSKKQQNTFTTLSQKIQTKINNDTDKLMNILTKDNIYKIIQENHDSFAHNNYFAIYKDFNVEESFNCFLLKEMYNHG